MYVIDDFNYGEVVSEKLERGQIEGTRPRQSDECLCATPFAEAVQLIADSEWRDRIAVMEAEKAFPSDLRRNLSQQLGRSVVKDQNGLGYCHLYALTSCVEVNRQQQGLPYVELAPESLGGVVGWQDRGGYMEADLEWAAKNGIAAREFCPGHLHNPNQFKQGWRESAKCHVPLEWFELGHEDMWREVVTALLMGYPVYPGYSWWGHSVMAGKLVTVGNEVCLEIENSWTPAWGDQGYGVLKGTRKVPDRGFGCYALRTATFAKN